MTGARSKITAPRRTAASPRPATKRPMCIIALRRWSIPPWKLSESTSPARSARVSIAVSGSTLRWMASKLRARLSIVGGFRGELELARAAERAVDALLGDDALDRLDARVEGAAQRLRLLEAASRACRKLWARPLLRCPPLRPEAPKPTVSASSTTTRRPSMARRRAAPRPVKPAPITATSKLPASAPGAAEAKAGALSCQ